jgi:nicotinate phosphoribosyltransferase
MAYKLVKYAGRHVLKTSEGKKTWTGEKQVYRSTGPDGRFAHDIVALHDEPTPEPAAEALLHPVMRSGRLLAPPALIAVRDRCAAQLAALPDEVRRLTLPAEYPVRFSDRLIALQRTVEDSASGHERPRHAMRR